MLTDDLNNNSPSSDAAPPQGNPMGLDKSNKKMMGSLGGYQSASSNSNPGGGSAGSSSSNSGGGSNDISSGMQKPKPGLKKKFTPKVIVGLLILVMLVVGSGAALFLSRQSQDVRQQASEPLIEDCSQYSLSTCETHEACELKTVANCSDYSGSQMLCSANSPPCNGGNSCTGSGGSCSGTYVNPSEGTCTGPSASGCSAFQEPNECGIQEGCVWIPTTQNCNTLSTETACNGWFTCTWNDCDQYSPSTCPGSCTVSYTCSGGAIEKCVNKPGSNPPPGGGGNATCEFKTASNGENEWCVGNNPTGDCYQGGQGNNYACYELNGNPGKAIKPDGAGYSGTNCDCPSTHPWKNPEYGETWCFKTSNICTGEYVSLIGIDTGEQCSITPQSCSNSTPPPGTGGPPPTPTPAPTLSCNSVCTSVAQCQATNPNWTCTNVDATGISWNAATPWAGPLDLGSLPGSGSVQGQADVVINNGTKLHQEFWKNNVGYTRTAPISNNRVLFGQATNWTATQTSLPGSGNIESYSLFMLPNGKIVQSMWRNNQGWTREVSTDSNGNPQWSSAPAWSGPLAPLPLCAGNAMQSQTEWILNNVVSQAIWCGNKGYTRTVPMNGSTVLWGQASEWAGPILPGPSLPGSENIQSQTIINMGNDYLIQGYWGNNQGWSREVPVGRRCRLSSNISSNTCQAAAPSPTPPPPTPLPSPSPSPIGPMCMSISMSIPQPTLGDSVNFTCGQVGGVKWYDFRVIEPSGNVVSLAATGQVSSSYTINQTGKFYAQCRVCTTDIGGSCNTEWEPIPGVPTIPPSPTSDPQIDPVFDSGSDRQ